MLKQDVMSAAPSGDPCVPPTPATTPATICSQTCAGGRALTAPQSTSPARLIPTITIHHVEIDVKRPGYRLMSVAPGGDRCATHTPAATPAAACLSRAPVDVRRFFTPAWHQLAHDATAAYDFHARTTSVDTFRHQVSLGLRYAFEHCTVTVIYSLDYFVLVPALPLS